MKKVYYAGKIGKNDWRHDIFENLRSVRLEEVESHTKYLTISNVTYNGPYFISCDHGCYHGENTHGVGVGSGYNLCSDGRRNEAMAYNDCLSYIKSSDIVFVYIDSMDCYGTISEIGYAKAIGKPIYIVLDNKKLSKDEIRDLWFVLQMGNTVVKTNDLCKEHDKFIEWTNSTNLYIKNIELPSEKQINYIKYLANKKDIKLIDISNVDKKDAGVIISYLKDTSKKVPDCMSKYFDLKN